MVALLPSRVFGGDELRTVVVIKVRERSVKRAASVVKGLLVSAAGPGRVVDENLWGDGVLGERWYGVDDGIYAAARLLEILGSTDTPPEAILNALPSSYSTPELKVKMEEGENHAFVEAFKEAVAGQTGMGSAFEGAEINTIDGLRADFEDGWGLVRPSNTTPVLVVRFDAETEEALERIKSMFRRQMLDLDPDLDLPF